MGFTVILNLEKLEYSTTGGNSIFDANMEKIDLYIDSRIPKVEAGQDVSQYQAGRIGSDGKAYIARADGIRQPCHGLFVAAAATGSQVQIQREGYIKNTAWSWTPGGDVYLSNASPGGLLTQTKPAYNVQRIGFALSSNEIIIERGELDTSTTQTQTTTTTTTTTTTP